MKAGLKLLAVTMLVLCIEGFYKGDNWPDLQKKEDLKDLGIGRIIEADGSKIVKIELYEVGRYGLKYVKDESLHDLSYDDLDHVEFPRSKWGYLSIHFREGEPVFNKK
ncbi:MAG: hypothetical protein H6605_10750 [Flavobacteriales bacterium]|nr:hypothetical protein [Flavobacteriales bacterium]